MLSGQIVRFRSGKRFLSGRPILSIISRQFEELGRWADLGHFAHFFARAALRHRVPLAPLHFCTNRKLPVEVPSFSVLN